MPPPYGGGGIIANLVLAKWTVVVSLIQQRFLSFLNVTDSAYTEFYHVLPQFFTMQHRLFFYRRQNTEDIVDGVKWIIKNGTKDAVGFISINAMIVGSPDRAPLTVDELSANLSWRTGTCFRCWFRTGRPADRPGGWPTDGVFPAAGSCSQPPPPLYISIVDAARAFPPPGRSVGL